MPPKKIQPAELQEFIFANNLKKMQLAEFLGVSNSLITQLLSGRTSLSHENFEKIIGNDAWDTRMLISDTPAQEDLREEIKRLSELNEKLMQENMALVQENMKLVDRIHFLTDKLLNN